MGSGLIKENTESVVTEYQLFCTLILKRVLYMTRIDMLNIGVPRMFPKRLGELIFVGGVCPLPPGQGGPGRREKRYVSRATGMSTTTLIRTPDPTCIPSRWRHDMRLPPFLPPTRLPPLSAPCALRRRVGTKKPSHASFPVLYTPLRQERLDNITKIMQILSHPKFYL